ncbi:MAG: hypothetical protein V4584_01635 [Verrucomicrobiota bacterium]
MPSIKSIIPLAAGLTIGTVGAILFIQSMPPTEGSAEEKVVRLEYELKKSNNRLAALEAADPHGRRRPGRTMADGARNLAEDFRAGKPVTPDDLFRATQPLIRDIEPFFGLMRTRELQRQTDAKAGELARKYSLTEAQQETLRKLLDQNAVDEAKRYTALMAQEGTRLADVTKATADIRLDNGLEQFMQNTLSGEKLAAFKSDRMLEKVGKVQQEADMKVTRLDTIVSLDETQRGQVFGMMARGARDFDPAMQFEGMGTDTSALPPGKSRQDAVLSVLRPEQLKAYEAEKAKRREEARKDMESMGLSLPADWSPLDHLDF